MARGLQRAPTLGNKVRAQIHQLEQMLPLVDNERRPHRDTERMIDGIHEVGCALCALVRGR